MRLAMTLAILTLACGDSGPSDLTRADLAGDYSLQTWNGNTLPHAYADTIPIPEGDPVITTGVLVADTLVLTETAGSRLVTWVDYGQGTLRAITPIAWAPPSAGLADSVTVTELFPAGPVEHHGVVVGTRLTLLIASLIRPGVYEYQRTQ